MNVSQYLTAFFALKNRHKNDLEEDTSDSDLIINNDQANSVEHWTTAAHSRIEMTDDFTLHPSRNFYLGVYLTIVGKLLTAS